MKQSEAVRDLEVKKAEYNSTIKSNKRALTRRTRSRPTSSSNG